MRKLLLFATLFWISLTSSFAQRVPKIEVYFQRHHSQQDLNNIKEELAVMGIELQYERVEFDERGHLTGLGIRVDCKDGFSGSAHMSPVPEDLSFGFVRDYREDSALPFAIGAIGEKKRDKKKNE
ncbi:MAG: hypothetical protein RMJ33_11695 [Saprospiraceae bacterium]|nr:hypothetical protein [Saprospiraceae bacterium]MDW8230493.1 hypothetical protein [Saprospiraceae bacterium]